MTVRLGLCGALRVTRGGEELSGPRLGSRKARVFAAALAAARGTAVTTDRLVEAVWPTRQPRDPQANLATLASRLRRTVGDGFVEPAVGAYSLGRAVVVDLDEAAELVGSATARLARAEPTLAVAAASRALEILGDLEDLPEECDGPWADPLKREATELRREARHLRATAALQTGQTVLARNSAHAATEADPYDERAHRDLMQACALDGRVTAALDVYTALASRLAGDLGTDPDPPTRLLHLALLRGETPEPRVVGATTSRRSGLVGRADELGRLDRAWGGATSGHSSLVLVAGVPGIGKTALLSEAAEVAGRTGGLVLAAHCRPGERSLFLQPFVEVLRPVLLALPEPTLHTLLGGHLPTWTRLLPELAELFGLPAATEMSHELARRRSFDAVVAVVSSLAERQPVLLTLDDLQYGADVTADLVAHVAVQVTRAPLLIVAATRTEALPRLSQLTALTDPLVLGPLGPSAVSALATAAGFGARSDEVHARSQGHPLSVVASLQALAAGTSGVPANIAASVSAQLDHLENGPAILAVAASVLGTRVDPVILAGLVDRPEVEVVLGCEQLVRAGLMVAAGRHYDFVNDLVQEAVDGTVPPALGVAYHRRAADLMADRPEQMAHHAHHAGEPERAARGYLEAARRARRAAALDDALALADLAGTHAEGAEPGLVAAVLLERARVNEARADFEAAEDDLLRARTMAGVGSDPRLRMRIARPLGGDVSIARRRPLAEVIAHNHEGLELAAGLGDAVAESIFRTRLVVLDATRLQLSDALARAREGVAQARATGFPEVVARSLDGLKSVHSYCGDATALRPVLDELVPLLTDLRTPWLLQWALLESSLVPAAAGRWSMARTRVDEALAVNRETGYGAYAGFFWAQRGWFARLAGDLDAALADGRRAVAETSPTDHPWWYATAAGTCAATLLEIGRRDEAAELAAAGLAVIGNEAGAAYRLRCLAPLAAAGGGGLEEADRLLHEIQSPNGRAWIWGADAYEAVAAGWLAAGEPGRAADAVRPLLAATARDWSTVHARARQSSSATRPATRSAPPSGTGT
ncbi:ATP-binding protein [Nocardioides cynanchi]|uniref:ATP-binding protein n=1 Tax=Nocardioides cynanchi TaxID=2558918 RepID=UPI0012447767|nr:AAA family ATPase [Nocardioides cynanchi]